MAALVQSGFARGASSPITVTLGSAPAPGNLLVLVICGWTQPLGVPTGFINVQADNGGSHANEATWTYYKVATGSEPLSFSFTGASDWHNIALLEIAGALTSFTTPYGACSGIGTTTITTGSLSAALATDLRLVCLEWDGAAPAATTPSGWTLLSPTTWQAPPTGNHGGGLWLIPPTTAGAQNITLQPAESYSAIWLDIQIPLDLSVAPSGALIFTGFAPTIPNSGIVSVTQIGAEAWVSNNPTANFTQIGAEAWVSNNPAMLATQIGVEVWRSVIDSTTGALTFTGFAPTARASVTSDPPSGLISLAGFAPTAGNDIASNPSAGAVLLTGFAPVPVVQTKSQFFFRSVF